ncbi:hypothetical protein OG883_11280 [Streptomyces sp. NBC_01142]|uniref:hypothetical protein n=1 Tax=Streptomyces sp. NBC_01142 TaxID=2975865 RepID=UPI00225481D6|nr:hypothetical protein [Streptomyces sp. NBC_01142]MCX4820478.1 hypothetical protein [Streptomyces sp. NBC_01142]
MRRTDLLALTPDTLAALTNRGLVKRASKDLGAGSGPTVTAEADGTVRGSFADGTKAELPPGGNLDTGACGCGAPGVCRHLIGLVLAYQRSADEAASEEAASDHTGSAESDADQADPEQAGPGRTASPEAASHQTDSPQATSAEASSSHAASAGTVPAVRSGWSPGAIDDETLTAAVGARAMAGARRAFERGFVARVHRPTAEHPGPWVELPTCTVRFPVPGEVGYALTDAAAALRGEVTALAVWAFRAADNSGSDSDADGSVTVGGRTAPGRTAAAPALDTALVHVDDLLMEGAVHAGPVLASTLHRTGSDLAAASLHWPAAAVAELTDQLDAYATRSAHYRPERFAALLTELHARHRASAVPEVLGAQEAGETPLRRVRLTSLGCRIGGDPQAPVAEVYLAHADAGVVLVLRKRWSATGDRPLTGHGLAVRRVLGSTLAALATGSLISENARRSPSRTLTLARGRLAATSVVPVGSAWTELPEPLLVRDLAKHTAPWDARPPRLIRPRVEAETVRVVEISRVESVGYDPAEQHLEAVVHDAVGTPALVRAAYNPLCPGALDALATVLDSGPRFLSGSLSRSGGRIRIDPIAVLSSTGVTVLDLAPFTSAAPVPSTSTAPADPLAAALDEALSALAAAAHRGVRRLPAPARTHLQEAAARLSLVGLDRAAALIRTFLEALPHEEAAAAEAWVNAQIHLLAAAELHQEGEPR